MGPLPHRCQLMNKVSPALVHSRSAGGFIRSARGRVVRAGAHRCVRGQGRVPSGHFRCRTLPRIVRSRAR